MARTSDPRAVYARLARSYDRGMSVMDVLLGFRAGRHWAVAGARGLVLELGVGTGRNLPLYPAGARVIGVDLSRPMLMQASRRAGASVSLVEADAAALPFADARFDVVVSTLTLCTYPDPVAVVREALRVLAPGGELHCMEHGEPGHAPLRAAARLLEPLAMRLEADHLLRNPARIVRDAGAEILSVQRSRGGIVWRVAARRRATASP